MSRAPRFLARALGAICVLLTLSWSLDLFRLMGSRGLIDPALAGLFGESMPLSIHRLLAPDSPHLDLAILLASLSLTLAGAWVTLVPGSFLAVATLFVVFLIVKHTFAIVAYGVFEYLHLGLFYVLMHGAAARWPEVLGPEAARLASWAARIHLAMAYVFAGLSKAIGPQWWTGESVWRAIGGHDSTGQRWIDGAALFHYPALLQALGIGVVLLETLYPLAFLRALRPFLLSGVVAMHVGTIAFQGLTLFGLTMIALNVGFWLAFADDQASRHESPQVAAV